MTDLVFEPFQKLSRLKRGCTITEKIDGTNAQICFDADGNLLVGSRKRQIWPEGYEGRDSCDNAGFAAWVYDNRPQLFETLGEGRHFGEWCGGKIQRGYNLVEKKFLLFNTSRWGEGRQEIPAELQDVGLGVVPVIYEGEFTTSAVDDAMALLLERGSLISDGFKNPEGVVVYHHALRNYFKVTYDHDGHGKGPNRQTDTVEG